MLFNKKIKKNTVRYLEKVWMIIICKFYDTTHTNVLKSIYNHDVIRIILIIF